MKNLTNSKNTSEAKSAVNLRIGEARLELTHGMHAGYFTIFTVVFFIAWC